MIANTVVTQRFVNTNQEESKAWSEDIPNGHNLSLTGILALFLVTARCCHLSSLNPSLQLTSVVSKVKQVIQPNPLS